METLSEQPFLQRTKGKVIAAFLLAALAIALALGISYFGFGELLKNVDAISTPNEKLLVLNNFFRQVTRLEQEHRAAAIKNPRSAYRKILEESRSLVLSLDTLLALSWNEEQTERLIEIEKILQRRNQLFIRYLRERSLQVNNKTYSAQLDSLSQFLLHYTPDSDSSVVTTEKKITTTSTLSAPTEERRNERSFFSRLFSSKKELNEPENRIEIKEELSIITDTIAISKQDSAIAHIGRIMRTLEETQRSSSEQLIRQELQLVNISASLLQQLMEILHEIENEEIELLQEKHVESVALFNTNISRMTVLVIIFFLGVAMLVFFILSDISKSQYYRRQLEKAKEQAEQLRAVKERFLANMSHEIRTPLQSIIGFSEQLKASGDYEAVRAIQHSSEHLLHIVNEVLDYSRIESNKFELDREPFNLKELIQEIEASHRIQADKKGLAFIVKTRGVKEINLLGDAFRLRQILHNLISNAIKFTNNGYVTLEVHVEDTGYRMECEFIISDTGIGIHAQDLERIFDQFEQANNAIGYQFGGTGLGLTIVKALVDAQYGKIDVQSEPGQGTVFTVKLGFDKAPFTTSEKTDTVETPTPIAFTGKVLVVDDDPLILRLCSIILEKHNIAHITEDQPEKLLRNKVPEDVSHVFLDIRMPHINGVKLRTELSALLPAGTKFIALTAHALPNEQKKFIELGFDSILLKPFREEELLQLLGITDDSAASTQEPVPLKLEALEKITMGDPELFQSVLKQFIEDCTVDLVDLRESISKKDSAQVREIIHKLSGRIGQFGGTAISTTLRETERELDKGTSFVNLEEAINQHTIDVEEFITDLKNQFVKVG